MSEGQGPPVEVRPGELAQALGRSGPGAVLQLLPGSHRGGVRLTRSVVLRGGPGVCLVSGRLIGPILQVRRSPGGTPPVVRLEQLSLVGGRGLRGAGVSVGPGAALTLVGCSFSKHWVLGEGAAVFVGPRARLTLEDCSFRGGRAQAGGAVYVAPGASLKARGCRFEENRARCGGAIALDAAQGVLVSCTLANNRAGNCGASLAGRGLGQVQLVAATCVPGDVVSEDGIFALKWSDDPDQ